MEKCPNGRLKPDQAVQISRSVVLKQPKCGLRGYLWNQKNSNWEVNRLNTVLQKFVFGQSDACGVGWVVKQCCSGDRAEGMGAAPTLTLWGRTHRLGESLLQEPPLPPCTRQQLQNISWGSWIWPWKKHSARGSGWDLLSFLESLYAVVPLGFFNLPPLLLPHPPPPAPAILPSFPVPNWCKLPHTWKQTAASARLDISQSHLPLSVFTYFFRCTVCPVVSWSLEMSHLCVTHFRVGVTKTVRPGKNCGRKDTLG